MSRRQTCPTLVLSPEPGEGAKHRHLHALKESFFCELLESEKERIYRYFRQLGNAVQVKDFIGFETSDRTKEVLVRGRDVRIMKSMALPKETKPSEESERLVGNVTIYTRGREKPFVGTIWDASDAALLMTGLDSEPGHLTGSGRTGMCTANL
jgi:hypothetical protein